MIFKMVHCTRDYKVFGLCSFPNIVKEHNISQNGYAFVLQNNIKQWGKKFRNSDTLFAPSLIFHC
jgi:hypothetical protein